MTNRKNKILSIAKQNDQPKKDECAECGSRNVHYNEKKQQIVCKACGAIFEELTPNEEKKFEKAHDQK